MDANTTSLGDFFRMISEEKNKVLTEGGNDLQETISPMDSYISALKVNQQIKEQTDPLNPANQNFVTFDDLKKHYQPYLEKLQIQLASIGGGGEVKFRRLDDVDSTTVAEDSYLSYRDSDGKFYFKSLPQSDSVDGDDVTVEVSNNVISVINLPENTPIGPVEQLSFNTSHEHQEVRVPGTLCWDPNDQTLNLTHPGDVTQQIGQESYAYVRNNTGSTITNGTLVQFSGAEQNGTARLEIDPMLADGTYPSLYALGVTTQDIEDGQDGRVTVWGKVRDLDMSAFNVGDILYADPSVSGGFTNVKPTAPNNVIPVAAVLNNTSDAGEIFVRPTVEQKMSYGVFTRNTNLSPTNNIPTVVGFDTAEISNGVSIVSNSRITVEQSGLYQIDWTLHWDSQATGFGTDPVYTFLRKNGVDIANTLRRNSVSDFDPAGQTFTFKRTLSLDADDYIEIVIVTTGGNVDLVSAAPITSPFAAPGTAAAEVTVDQIQL